MKNRFILIVALMTFFLFKLHAQHVRVQLNFPVGVFVNAPGPPPYAGAVWIGPEWSWNGREYVHVPGYWMRVKHKRGNWRPGCWRHTRRGYVWIPGRWH